MWQLQLYRHTTVLRIHEACCVSCATIHCKQSLLEGPGERAHAMSWPGMHWLGTPRYVVAWHAWGCRGRERGLCTASQWPAGRFGIVEKASEDQARPSRVHSPFALQPLPPTPTPTALAVPGGDNDDDDDAATVTTSTRATKAMAISMTMTMQRPCQG